MRPERYVPRRISEVKVGDSRVSIVGKVVEPKNSSFLIEDDSGTAEIFSEKIPEAGTVVRAFCNFSDGTLKADVLQSLNGFDVNLYHKVQDLYRKVGV